MQSLQTTPTVHTFPQLRRFAFLSLLNPRVVFQKWRWPWLHCPSKGIAVDKQAQDDVMHLSRFRKADGLAGQAFNTRP
jgi:hypothetical protein